MKTFLIIFVATSLQVYSTTAQAVTCTCDLTAGTCDVGCCCDSNCSTADVDSFACSNATFNADSKLCVNELVYVNNLPSTTVVTDNGVFCIVRQSDESLNSYTEPSLLQTQADFDATSAEYPTFTYDLTPSTTTSTVNYYVAGDTIDIRYSNGLWGKLALPTAGIANTCFDNNPVSYLENQNSLCGRQITTADCAANSFLDASIYSGFQIAPTPVLNFSNFSGPFVNVTICNDSVSAIDTSCNNVAETVAYTIRFNGTFGISEACVSITQESIPSTPTNYVQNFSVEFVSAQTNTSLTPDVRSGNPGYITGKPLRTATGNSTQSNSTFNLDATILTLFSAGPDGMCTNGTGKQINFGEDERTGCLISYNSLANCNETFNEIMAFLSPPPCTDQGCPDPKWYVGTFGNVLVTSTGDWVPVNFSQISSPYTNEVAGNGCNSMLVGLSYTVYFANTGSLSNPQPKVIGITCTPVTQTLRYECFGSSCMTNSNQYAEVTSSVTFIDSSNSPASILRQRPTVNARLPSDFFYPFTAN